jgi:hypothetical protein
LALALLVMLVCLHYLLRGAASPGGRTDQAAAGAADGGGGQRHALHAGLWRLLDPSMMRNVLRTDVAEAAS